MERKLGSWAKSLEDVTTDMEMQSSSRKYILTTSYQSRSVNSSFEPSGSYRRRRGWTAGIHWDWLH